MTYSEPSAIAERLDAVLIAVPARKLNGLRSLKPYKRNRAAELLADDKALRVGHHNIPLIDPCKPASNDNLNFVAIALQAGTQALNKRKAKRAR